jgi:hypothetical protein
MFLSIRSLYHKQIPARNTISLGQTSKLQAQVKASPAAWWVKQVGKDMALVPLKLLHILLAGYEPFFNTHNKALPQPYRINEDF